MKSWWQEGLARAFSAVPLVFVATTAALGMLGLAAGLLGLPLLFILASWTAKYALALIDHGARGLPPPVLSVEMVNPLNARPIAVLLLLATAVGATRLAAHAWPPAGPVVGILGTAMFPAAIAVLAIDDPWLLAFWPPRVGAVMWALGLSYLVLLLISVLLLYGLYLGVGQLRPVFLLPLGLEGLLALATLLGAALFDRREALGLEAWASPQRESARAAVAGTRARERVLDEIYGYVRVRRLEQAWQRTESYLDDAGWDIELCRWLRDRAAGWDEDSIAQALTRRLVARLDALGRSDEALEEIDAWWRSGRRYRPQNGRELARLVALARSLDRPALAERLLDECAAFFPADPEVRALLEGRRTRGA